MTIPISPAAPANSAAGGDTRPACWCLALALAFFPLLLTLPVDSDRAIPFMLLPSIVLGFRFLLRPGNRAEHTDRLLLLFAGLISVFGLATNPHPAPLVVATASWVMVIFGAATAGRVAADAQGKRLLFTSITAAGVIGMILVRWQGLSPQEAFPCYGHPRVFGMAMMTAAMASLALLVVEPPKSRAMRLVNFLAASTVWTALLWSGSRGPLAGMAVALAAWWFFAPAAERRRLLIWVPVLTVIGMLASFCLGDPLGSLGWWTAAARTDGVTTVAQLTSNRTAIWELVWHTILNSPWIGHGQDAYRYIRPRQDGDQPHDFLLQWILEFGFIGAIALVSVLIRRIWRGLRASVSAGINAGTSISEAAETENNAWRRAAAACLLTSAGAGLFDGVFYHGVVFVPTAIFAGIAGSRAIPSASLLVSRANQVFTRSLLVLCTGILLLHSWLFFHLLAPPPASPDALVARTLRVFPSSTIGLWRWLDTWDKTEPNVALDWALWAQPRSFIPAVYFDRAAKYYLERGDLRDADHQFVMAVATTHISSKKHFEDLLFVTREVEAGHTPVWPDTTPTATSHKPSPLPAPASISPVNHHAQQ